MQYYTKKIFFSGISGVILTASLLVFSLFSSSAASHQTSVELKADFIEAAVKKYIKDHTSAEISTVLIKDIRWPGKVILPHGDLTFRIEPKYKKGLIGKVHLMMFLNVNGVFRKRLAVVADVEKVANVVVADIPILRGQIIQASHLKLRSVELSQVNGEPVMDLDSIIGKRASKQIYPETVILDGDVEIPPVLKRGDTVKIVVNFSNLTATAYGVVRENGIIGEKIKVVNIDSKKTLYATVVDRHTVKIDF